MHEWIFRVPFQCWGLYGDEGNSREWNEFSICPRRAGQQSPLEVTSTGQQGFHEGGSAGAGASLARLSHHWFEEDLTAAKQAPPGCGDRFAGTLHDVLIRKAVLGRDAQVVLWGFGGPLPTEEDSRET